MSIESTFSDKELESIAKKESDLTNKEVFFLNYNNKKIWIKKATTTISSNLHKFYYKLFPFEILLPVSQKNKEESILHETNKLIRFKTYGINTPDVLGVNSKFFAIEDCDVNIYEIIKRCDSKEKADFLIDKIIETLALIHNNNEYHGGAQCRNFTYYNDKVYVIDLEDSFDDNIDLKLLQFRDLLLLLLSFTKRNINYSIDYENIINKYIGLTNNKDFVIRFIKLANKLSFLMKLSKIEFINNLLGKDVKGFFKLFEVLKNLKNK